MPARFLKIGEPAHDHERQGLRSLVDGLDEDYFVYGNPWLVNSQGVIFEVDAIVQAPHAIYVVEIKSWTGLIKGNDLDWYTPEPVRNPLRLNRKTAQILATLLDLRCGRGLRPFVEGLVYLSHAQPSQVQLTAPSCVGRVHTRSSIFDALRDGGALVRREGRWPSVDARAQDALHKILTDITRGQPQPPRRIGAWLLMASIERTERFQEYLAEHDLDKDRKILRVHTVPWDASEAERKRIEEQFRWECQALRRVAAHPNIIHSSQPFQSEAGFVLPFEPFPGITLQTWIDEQFNQANPDLQARVDVWKQIAQAVAYAHEQGIVHRLLRPEVVLVNDRRKEAGQGVEVRLGGFDLAKRIQPSNTQTIAVSNLTDDRKQWAAPEVLRDFSNVDGRADQFGLGVLLGALLVGRPLIHSTEDYQRSGYILPRARDRQPTLSEVFDEILRRLMAPLPVNRYPSVQDAINQLDRIQQLRRGSAVAAAVAAPPEPRLDPENIPDNTRLNDDYEVTGRLGAGGLATVYAARHSLSATTRALKVARPGHEAALVAEYEALRKLDHPNIVKAIDVSGSLIPQRKTLILDRIKGSLLSAWRNEGSRSSTENRQICDNLLAALEYLESKGVIHKDIKPDNLIVSEDGLVLIDFSLAGHEVADTTIGTPLYRDPSLERWNHASDRYAAALCIFEVYVGRHAFSGRAPWPGEVLALDASELDRPELVRFLRRALHTTQADRYPSAAAMRAALREALVTIPKPQTVASNDHPNARYGSELPLSAAEIEPMLVDALQRLGIFYQGELVALDADALKNLQGIGNRRLALALSARERLHQNHVQPIVSRPRVRLALWPTLVGDNTDAVHLALPPAIFEALRRAGYHTVGALAHATRQELVNLPTIGDASLGALIAALQRFSERTNQADEAAEPTSLAAFWKLAAQPLPPDPRDAVERCYGLRLPRLTALELAQERKIHQSSVSRDLKEGERLLDRNALAPLWQRLEAHLNSAGGVMRLGDLTERLCESLPAAEIEAEGLVRLLAKLSCASFALLEDVQPCDELVARVGFEPKAIEEFIAVAIDLAAWPPKEPQAVRRNLRACLPEYQDDPLGLALRLLPELRLTQEGALFKLGVPTKDALLHTISRLSLPCSFQQVQAKFIEFFGEAVLAPSSEDLPALLQDHGEFVVDLDKQQLDTAAARSIRSEPDPQRPFDRLPTPLAASYAQTLRERLQQPFRFHLVVTPPELLHENGPNLARLLGVPYINFEERLFRPLSAPQLAALDRAERYKAQRENLTRSVEDTFHDIIRAEGRPERTLVLGHTALWGVAGTIHLVSKLYDLTRQGSSGVWVLVIPGLAHKRQVYFNENPDLLVFHLPEVTVPMPDLLTLTNP
jgi:serine/threonine protein kinase